MHPILKFFLPVMLLFICMSAKGQVCNGSLGDPVFTFDFGSGNSPQFPVTNYTFISGSCPNDGQYSLSKTESGCHDDTWHKVTKDHTGNDGYMMVVNADNVAGKEFFSKQTTVDGANVLCENTTYEFSAYILNLIKAGQSGFNEPKITFRIETLTGDLIRESEPLAVPATANPDGWEKYGVFFTTTAGVTAVVVKMVNNAPGGSGNDFVLDDIAFRACGPVVQAGITDDAGNISAESTNLCVGQSKIYNIKSSLTSDPTFKYQWQQSVDNGAVWIDMPGKESLILTEPFPTDKPIGAYQYRLGVAKGGNISSLNCRVYSNAVTINIAPLPTPTGLQPKTVCEGNVLTLTADGGATYKWTGPGITGSDSHNPLIIPIASSTDAGHYTVEVISAANCSTFRGVDVTVNSKPVITIDAVLPVCKGSSTPLTASVTNPGTYTYSWSPDAGLSNVHSATTMASPDHSTLYTLTVTNSLTNCSGTDTVLVTVLDLPVADAGTDKKIFEGQSVKLGGTISPSNNGLSYSWLPVDYLDDPHSPTPVANPPFDVPYQLTVTPANGCPAVTDDVFVRVFQKIIIPSTFTPNNDGMNDLWVIEALETYPESTMFIYNRNGKQVFQSKGYSQAWDGKFNGSQLPAGTYYYVIDLKNGTPNLSGWVLLVR
jgi:gliding motility-associated-like protein